MLATANPVTTYRVFLYEPLDWCVVPHSLPPISSSIQRKLLEYPAVVKRKTPKNAPIMIRI